jgi:lauroyl/myristoyl acyltransferase
VLRDAGRIRAYLHDSPRGIVIATIHMGDYLEGLRQLRLVAPPGRPIYVLRRRGTDEREQRAFDRVGGSGLTVVRSGRDSLTTVVRALRHGAMMVALYDLPARYARTVPVVFFDRPAAFVRGPAELAVLGDADVLPLLCHYDAALTAIASAAPVVAAAPVPRDRTARTASLTQHLCSLAEAHIRAYPSQWGHWSLIDELLTISP